jgi:hypothetical protein
MKTPSYRHGALALRGIRIDSYSLEVEDAEGLIGDRASQSAFRQVLARFQQQIVSAGTSGSGVDLEELSNCELDAIIHGAHAQARDPERKAIALAIAEFSASLAHVIHQFMLHPSWLGVERIAVGGGFKQSAIGRIAIRRTAEQLLRDGACATLQLLRHESDDAGLAGWAPVLPDHINRTGRPILAVDIGGTNVRCGIVAPTATSDPAAKCVVAREKWNHADAESKRDDLVEGILATLRHLIERADVERLQLAPFIGIACPGIIHANGSIERGAQNLPGEWQRSNFHLPRRIWQGIPSIQGAKTLVGMHNDAVIQGLSELPFITGIDRWAVLTIGTGLGNASFTNLPEIRRGQD